MIARAMQHLQRGEVGDGVNPLDQGLGDFTETRLENIQNVFPSLLNKSLLQPLLQSLLQPLLPGFLL